jgi:DNA-binding transcriptional regulator YiaG
MNEAMAIKRVRRLARTGQLSELREELGLSRGDVARAVGVSQPTVWRWESGKRRCTGRNAIALLELLEVE